MSTEALSRPHTPEFAGRQFLPAAALLLLLAALSAPAANWPQWRGPNGDGISPETNVPFKWSATENVVWRTPVPGEGHSSPVVWQDSVFLTTAVSNSQERLLLRFDARTGKILWQRSVVTATVEAMHRENSPASSTPVTDGELVFTSFQNGKRVDLQAYDFTGKQIWSVQPLEFNGEHGYSYTPLLYRDLLIFDCRQEGEAALLALDKRTGKVRWRVEPAKRRISHITPLLINDGWPTASHRERQRRNAQREPGHRRDVVVVSRAFRRGGGRLELRGRTGVRDGWLSEPHPDGRARGWQRRRDGHPCGVEISPSGDLRPVAGLSRRSFLLGPR